MLNWIAARLREPSTHATLTSLFGAGGVLGVATLDEKAIGAVALGIAAIFGALGFGKKEKATET
tara:strand:- start:778 stop:969 length:192 start_codon:yes stop_codon:yes gene_type:complete